MGPSKVTHQPLRRQAPGWCAHMQDKFVLRQDDLEQRCRCLVGEAQPH